jgi:hypothetical protein
VVADSQCRSHCAAFGAIIAVFSMGEDVVPEERVLSSITGERGQCVAGVHARGWNHVMGHSKSPEHFPAGVARVSPTRAAETVLFLELSVCINTPKEVRG